MDLALNSLASHTVVSAALCQGAQILHVGSFLNKSGHFFGENTGKFQGFVILSSLCDLDQSVIDLFAKQLNNTLNLHLITNRPDGLGQLLWEEFA